MIASVIIPAFNAAATIGSTLDSVFGQTRPADEIVVVDDGSTDATVDILSSFAERVRLFRQPNRGPAAARNRAVHEARGSVLAFLDADDLWTPDKLERQLAVLQACPDVDLVCTNLQDQFEDGRRRETTIVDFGQSACSGCSHESPAPDTYAFLQPLTSALLLKNIVHTPTVVARCTAVEEAGLFDESLRIAEDLNLWFEIARTSRVAYIDRVLCIRRLHGGNITQNRTLLQLCHARMLGAWLQRDDVVWLDGHRDQLRRRLAGIEASAGRRLVRDGRLAEGREFLGRSLRHQFHFKALAWHMLSRSPGWVRRVALGSG